MIVDLIHIIEQIVFNTGFSQQYVHVTGHTARNRVNGKADFGAAANHHISQLFHYVLGL